MTKEGFEHVKTIIAKIFPDLKVALEDDDSISIGPGISLQTETRPRKFKTFKGELERPATCYIASVELRDDYAIIGERWSLYPILEDILIFILKDKLTWATL